MLGGNMKETGIVRRIDELGRVVIPKELRKVLKLKEGELLEIYTNDKQELVLKKYNEVGADSDQLQAMCKILYKTTGKETFICDTGAILAHCGGSEPLEGEEISDELYKLLVNRRSRHLTDNPVKPTEMSSDEGGEQYIVPLVSRGDLYGGIVLSAHKLDGSDFVVCDAMAQYLAYNIG